MKTIEFMDLSDNEVTEAIKDILSECFSKVDIRKIDRDYDKEEIELAAFLDGYLAIAKLRKPVGFPTLCYGGIQLFFKNISLSEEQKAVIERKYQQFLFAALYRDFIQDNPYVKYEEQQNSMIQTHTDFTITERTEPFTLQEVWDFIDDTMIREQDAHELKERIISLLQTEREHCGDYQQAELELE